MNKLGVFKAVTCFLVGAGVSQIVSGIVDANVPQNTKTEKVLVFAGKTGISMLVSEAVRIHVGIKIDDVAASMSKLVNK